MAKHDPNRERKDRIARGGYRKEGDREQAKTDKDAKRAQGTRRDQNKRRGR